MLKKLILLFCLFSTAAWCGRPVHAEMRPATKIRAGTPPYEVIEKILRANQKHIALATSSTAPSTPESPLLTWLADADARIQPGLLLDKTVGRIFTARNLGNQLVLATGSVDYGVRYLHTPVLLITGSTDSQAIRLFMEGYRDLEPQVRDELDHLHLPLTEMEPGSKNKKSLPLAEKLLDNTERNIDYQVAQAVARYSDRVENGRLVVIGSVLDLDNQYGHGAGRLVIINVNGERDAAKLRASQHMVRLDRQLLATVGRQRPAAPPQVPPAASKKP